MKISCSDIWSKCARRWWWFSPVFSGGSRWWRCRSRWSRRRRPREGRWGTWCYCSTFSTSASPSQASIISLSEIDMTAISHFKCIFLFSWRSGMKLSEKCCGTTDNHQVVSDLLQLLSLLERTCRTQSTELTDHQKPNISKINYSKKAQPWKFIFINAAIILILIQRCQDISLVSSPKIPSVVFSNVKTVARHWS